MARADLLVGLVKNGLEGEMDLFRETARAIASEAAAKKQLNLANKLDSLLETTVSGFGLSDVGSNAENRPYIFKKPVRSLDSLILASDVRSSCLEIIQEHVQRDKLREYNLTPRHRLLLSGPPGNGKTSLAEAIAYELSVPFYVVRYEGIIASHLGETAKQLAKVFETAKSQRCVLFFDEFDALSKERQDPNEVGEIKRVVNSLLLQIDSLPSNVIVIGATNHAEMLDQAAWRRFQSRISLSAPDASLLEEWLERFQNDSNQSFEVANEKMASALLGMSFADLENFSLSVLRKFVLNKPKGGIKTIVCDQINNKAQYISPHC